jgi:hypothetical protein
MNTKRSTACWANCKLKPDLSCLGVIGLRYSQPEQACMLTASMTWAAGCTETAMWRPWIPEGYRWWNCAAVHRLYQGVLYLLNLMRFHRTRISVILFTHVIKSTALPAPNSTKLTKTQQRYVLICYTKFHPNRPINVESTNRYSKKP